MLGSSLSRVKEELGYDELANEFVSKNEGDGDGDFNEDGLLDIDEFPTKVLATCSDKSSVGEEIFEGNSEGRFVGELGRFVDFC